MEGGQGEARGGLGWFAAGRGAGPVKSGYLCESITRAQNCISGHTSFGGTGALQRPEGPMATNPWPLRVNAEGKPRRLSLYRVTPVGDLVGHIGFWVWPRFSDWGRGTILRPDLSLSGVRVVGRGLATGREERGTPPSDLGGPEELLLLPSGRKASN